MSQLRGRYVPVVALVVVPSVLVAVAMTSLYFIALPSMPILRAYYFNQQEQTYATDVVPLLAHIGFGSLALVLGPINLVNALRNGYTRSHRVVGSVYAVAVSASATCAVFMSFQAYPGVIAYGRQIVTSGFCLLGLSWMLTLALALRASVIRHDITSHRFWIITNISLTFAAVLIRIENGAVIAADQFSRLYPFLAWASWVPCVLVGMLLARKVNQTRGKVDRNRTSVPAPRQGSASRRPVRPDNQRHIRHMSVRRPDWLRPVDHPASAWNRLLAWAIDWLCISGWVVVTAAVGVPLYFAGVIRTGSPLVLNVVAALVMVVPVTVIFAALESSTRGATVGKRARGLAVVDAETGEPLTFRRSLLRNSLKLLLPWLLGHAVVYALLGAGTGSPPWWLWFVTAASYLLPVLWVVALLVGSGRTPYDAAARSVVRAVPEPAEAARTSSRSVTVTTMGVRSRGKTATGIADDPPAARLSTTCDPTEG